MFMIYKLFYEFYEKERKDSKGDEYADKNECFTKWGG